MKQAVPSYNTYSFSVRLYAVYTLTLTHACRTRSLPPPPTMIIDNYNQEWSVPRGKLGMLLFCWYLNFVCCFNLKVFLLWSAIATALERKQQLWSVNRTKRKRQLCSGDDGFVTWRSPSYRLGKESIIPCSMAVKGMDTNYQTRPFS